MPQVPSAPIEAYAIEAPGGATAGPDSQELHASELSALGELRSLLREQMARSAVGTVGARPWLRWRL